MTERHPQRRPSAEQVTRALAERSAGPLLHPTEPVRLTVGHLSLDAEPAGAATALGAVARRRGRRPRLAGALAAAVVLLVVVSAALAWPGGDGGPRPAGLQPTGSEPAESPAAESPATTVAVAAGVEPATPTTPVPPPGRPPPAAGADAAEGPGNGRGNAHGHDRPRPGGDEGDEGVGDD
jgi:hypothetical protein